MKYTVLSEVDTEVWLSNVQKTLVLLKQVMGAYDEKCEEYKLLAIDTYHRTPLRKLWSQIMYGLYSTDDIIVGCWSGDLSSLGGFFGKRLTKIPSIPFSIREIGELADKYIEEGTSDFVINLSSAWSVYASKPFAIEESDVLNYLRVLKIHETCKNALIEARKYDETFDVVEDSRSRS